MSYECNECQALSRRDFLAKGGASLAALAAADPLMNLVGSAYAQSAGGTGNLLVLCELKGGMDALSFLVPYQNSVYQNRRPRLALSTDEVLPLGDRPEYAITGQMPFFSELYEQGQLAIVQQTGYPDSNGSHFESQEIFRFGVRNLSAAGIGNVSWYERLRAMYFDQPYGVLDTRRVGDPTKYGYPDRTFRKAAQEAFGRLARLKNGTRSGQQQQVLEQYARIDNIGAQLRERTDAFESSGDNRGDFFRAAQYVSADLNTQIVKLSYGGFDTHGSQRSANERLFPRINDHFQQFVQDLQQLGMWNRTAVVFYTEFGRRNAENGSPGTDHGYGSHMMLAGPGVNGGLFGQAVTTSDLNERSLPYYVDFRAVFGSAIRDWLGFSPDPIFNVGGETFDSNVGGALFR